MPHFIQQFNEQLSELLPGNARVLLAVSGGLDSMTMLHAFADIYRRQPGSVGGLHVAHLNHLLR
ncbi:MAG: hypothetical protein K9M57_07685, partial [Phycisphaerae bacterium]|nr:hypothetical protein [Phycisphaerae bacterium]